MSLDAHSYRRAAYPLLPSRSPRYLSDEDLAAQLDLCHDTPVMVKQTDAGLQTWHCASCGYEAKIMAGTQLDAPHLRPHTREQVSV